MNAMKHARTSRGLLLKQAAAALKTDSGNLSRIENGKQRPSVELAKRMAAFYGLSMDEIFGPLAADTKAA